MEREAVWWGVSCWVLSSFALGWGMRRTVLPAVDGVGRGAGLGGVQVLPPDLDLRVQVHHHDVGDAAVAPRVAADAAVAVEALE